ncbi:MAG: ATP-dependent helicase/nuclease subunit A [Paracoccaceae bacterium]
MDDATRAQVRAADPAGSAWVSANAGSGKTRVLTDRVARLLLAGARPEKILCLTYTKAAAAEMQTRLFALLGRWAMMDDDALIVELQSRSESPLALEDGALDRARRLFASALETPGGLKIQTIHAFCDALLRRFPLEAGVSPRFQVLDDREKDRMLTALRDRMAEDAEAGIDDAFDAAADRLGEGAMGALTEEILHKRDLFGADDAALAQAFGMDADATDAQLMDEAAAALDDGALADLAAGLGRAGKRGKDRIPGIKAVLDALQTYRGAEAVEIAAATLLKADGDPYAPAWLLGAKLAEGDEALCDLYLDVAGGVRRAGDVRRSVEALRKSRDLARFAHALIAAYEAEKQTLSALDFSDLVARAGALLTTADMAAWALWKLDGGVDHILIDEAQDTAPAQWTVIRAVAEEFFAGAGARDEARTLFVVGDEKQSIYSFQGADPAEFGRMRAHFADRLLGAPQPLHVGELAHSFRSAPAILSLVDRVFEADAEGLNATGTPPRHVAYRAEAPGLIEMWPFFGKLDEAEEPEWSDPVDAPAPSAPKPRLAAAIAEHVAGLLHEGAPIPDRKAGGWRALRPRDVLILVQSRKGLAPGIIRGLKNRAIDVSGADRLILTEELAVKDLLALLRVALDPGDDLSLAALLRSPLGQVSEAGLYDLAHSRKGRLRDVLADQPAAAPVASKLVEETIAGADFRRPFELLSRALVEHDGRAALLARLGPEAEDPIDELLAQALAYERAETPTLAGFLSWIDAADKMAVKREQGGGADEVRVMTVHGAKGLEAPFVVLPDTGPRGGAPQGRSVLPVIGRDGAVAAWSVPKADRPQALIDAVERQETREQQERKRLLYVALTRAEDRLLIAGAGDETKIDASWYGMIRAGMEALGATPVAAPAALAREPAGQALRLAPGWPAPGTAPIAETARAPSAPAPAPAVPAPMLRPGPPAPAPRRVSPSGLAAQVADHGDLTGPSHEQTVAMARGDLVHALAEALADLPPPARATAIPALIARHGAAVPVALRAGCGAEALAALALPDLAPFLGPDSAAEVGLSVDLPGLGARLAGRIDRIAFPPGRILLLDFKTGRAPEPGDPAPEAYLRQLAAYRAALARLHPDRSVEAHLLWTAAARLDRAPDAALDAAWSRMTGAALAP